jgi:hypothetical protein
MVLYSGKLLQIYLCYRYIKTNITLISSTAIGLLERHPELIDWEIIWSNAGIFDNNQM